MAEEDTRQSSGSTSASTSTTTSGTATTENAEMICGCPEPGPETIQVEQVLAANMAQRVVEFTMTVPAAKPDIDQILDVYVKDVDITDVTVIRDKVILRGHLEVKVMYVAHLPNQPVHAFEQRHVRFTRDIEVLGARPGMNCNADVAVEFIDYDFDACEDRRKVDITIVLKMWVRVMDTTEMDVYALGPVTEVDHVEHYTASVVHAEPQEVTKASEFGAVEYVPVEENVVVTGPLQPEAGVPTTVTGTATVNGNRVNVRTGPGTNYPVITQVNMGDVVTLRDQAFGWYKVTLQDGTTGWIAGWLLNVSATSKG